MIWKFLKSLIIRDDKPPYVYVPTIEQLVNLKLKFEQIVGKPPTMLFCSNSVYKYLREYDFVKDQVGFPLKIFGMKIINQGESFHSVLGHQMYLSCEELGCQ